MQTITIGGVDVTSRIRLVDGIVALESAADGDKAESTIVVDDPLGELNFLQLQEVISVESDCTGATRCFTGMLEQITNTRATFPTGPGRIWTMSVVDLNELLHRRVIHLASAKRPTESGNARMAWLLSTVGMSGVVFDNGGIAPNPWHFSATDYRGEYADQVISDISISSVSDVTGLLSFVYWDQTAAQASLFNASPVEVLHTSTLRISNDINDIDETTTFWAYQQPELNTRGDQIFDGVYFMANGVSVYRTRPATFTEFGVHRDGVFQTDRVGSDITVVKAHADQFLVYHSGKLDTITCTIRLPSSKVNLIDAGMRLAVKFVHLPGFETFQWTRVQRRTIRFTPGVNDFYDMDLVLSNAGVAVPGGGDPGTFPFQPNCDLGFVQYKLNTGTSPGGITLDTAPTVGNTLFYVFAGRTTSVGSFPPATGTWTLLGEIDQGVAGAATCGLYYKTVEAGDTAVWTLALATADRALMAEFQGAMTFDVVASRLVAPVGSSDDPTISITPTAGKKALLISAVTSNFAAGSPPGAPYTFDPATGMTLIYGGGTPQGPPSMGVNFQIVENTTGSYLVGSTGSAQPFENQNIVAAAFTCDASAEPPDPGQEVPGEFVAFGDGSTMAFTTAFPYAAGSLKVWVDGHPILLGLTETDPTTGAFTLDFAPLGANGDSPAERVTATYQATAQPILSRTTITALDSAADFLTAVADMSIDLLIVSDVDGPFDWDGVEIDVDRTARPLIIRASGTPTFNGNGSTSSGVFFWGLNGPCKWITMEGDAGRFIADGIGLAQAGVHELRSGDHISLTGWTCRNLTRDHAVPGSAAHKSFGLYGSGAGGRNLDHILVDDWLFEEPAINRDLSMIQLDSSALTNGSVQITNIVGTGYCLPFYGGVKTTNLLLDTWTLDDCGKASTPASILIAAVAISGQYRNITATASDPLQNNSTGSFINGGGNSGI